jgi:1-acyl-sn-glycerol-3-phosphate acyltransferase
MGLLTIGFILLSCILLSYLIPQKVLDRYLKAGCRFLFRVLFIRVRVEGADAVDPARTALFMANHVSLFDVPLLEGTIPAFVRAVEAARQFRWPVYGWAVRRIGNIPIRREDVHSSIRSIRRAEDWLKGGKSLVILPEGSRTLDGRLRPFKKLPFFLAKQANVDVVPIGMSGLFHLKAKHSWIVRPTTVKVKFGRPVSAETIRSLSVEELRDRVRDAIQNLVERP